MVAGLGLVVVDVRINGFDLVPDLVGWGVVLAGLAKLAGRSPWFTAAKVAAAFGVVLGIPLQFAKAESVVSALEGVVLAVFVFGTCAGIRAVVANERTRDTADLIRWSNLALTLVALFATVPGGPMEVTGPVAFGVVLAVIAGFASFVWFLAFLWANRAEPVLGASSSTFQSDPAH